MKPVRIQLKRTRGFRLQEVSLSINGLPAVKVARPTKWGNPFEVSEHGRITAINRFREDIGNPNSRLGFSPDEIEQLRGKNLACFCKLTDACHADLLLEYSNN